MTKKTEYYLLNTVIDYFRLPIVNLKYFLDTMYKDGATVTKTKNEWGNGFIYELIDPQNTKYPIQIEKIEYNYFKSLLPTT